MPEASKVNAIICCSLCLAHFPNQHHVSLVKHVTDVEVLIFSLTCQLYLAVAVPKMLYAVDIWFQPIYSETSNMTKCGSKGVATKLARVQCIALLSITGTMCTTASDVLEILANVWSIELHIQNLCQQAALWLATCPLIQYIV